MYTTVDRDYFVTTHKSFEDLISYLEVPGKFEKEHYLLGQNRCTFEDFLWNKFDCGNMTVLVYSIHYCEWVIQIQKHTEEI